MKRFVIVLVVFVGIVLMSFPATASAGGGPDNFSLKVAWGQRDAYGYAVSTWTAKSSFSRFVNTYTYFRYLSTSYGGQRTFTPEAVTANFSADPSSMWLATGFQFKNPNATTSFVGSNWVGFSGCAQGPTFVYDRQNEKLVVTVANTTGKQLFLTINNGRSWSKVLVGKARAFNLKAKVLGEVRLFNRPTLSSSECANFWWHPTY